MNQKLDVLHRFLSKNSRFESLAAVGFAGPLGFVAILER